MTEEGVYPFAKASPSVRIRAMPIVSLPETAEQWQALERVVAPDIFTSWTWIGTLLACLPQEHGSSLLVAERGVEVVGLGIGIERRRWHHFILPANSIALNETGDDLFDCIAIEHNGFLTRKQDRDEVLTAFLSWFESTRTNLDELVLSGLDACPVLPDTMLGDSEIKPFFRVDLDRVRACGNDLLALLSSNTRSRLRQSIRACEAFGPLAIEAATTTAQALDFFSGLKEFHVAWWLRRGRTHAFSRPFFETFHRRLIETGMNTGAVQMLRISAGDTTLGYLYGLIAGNTVYAYQSGFLNEDPKRRFGLVSHALAIGFNAQCGLGLYDFLAGHNQMKQSLSTERGTMVWTRVRKKRLRFRVEAALRRLTQPSGR